MVERVIGRKVKMINVRKYILNLFVVTFVMLFFAGLGLNENSYAMSKQEVLNKYNLNLKELKYLMSFSKDLEEQYDIRIDENNIGNRDVTLLLSMAYNRIAENSDLAILPGFLSNELGRDFLTSKVGTVYKYENFSLMYMDFDRSFGIGKNDTTCFNSEEETDAVYQSILNQKTADLKNIPVAIYATDVVNIFGNRVGFLNLEKGEDENSSEDQFYRLYWGNVDDYKQTNIWLKDPRVGQFSSCNISFDLKEMQDDLNFCWACRLIDFSVDAVNVMSYTASKTLAPYYPIIFGLMFAFWLLKLVWSKFSFKGADFTNIHKDVLPKILMVGIVLLIIANLNSTFFYYIARPIVSASTGFATMLDNKGDVKDCSYFKNKQRFKNIATYSNSKAAKIANEVDFEKYSFMQDKDINLKQEFVCSVYGVFEINNNMISMVLFSLEYSELDWSMILKGFIVYFAFIMSFFVSLYLIDAIFNIAIAIVFTPFCLMKWAVPIGPFKLEIKTVINTFIEQGTKIFVLFFSTYVFSTLMFGAMSGVGANFVDMLQSPDYSAVIVANLLDFNSVDLLGYIIILIIGVELVRSSKEIAKKFTDGILGTSNTSGMPADVLFEKLDKYRKGLWKKFRGTSEKDGKSLIKEFKARRGK